MIIAMSCETQYVNLVSVNHPAKVDTYFASHMVDIAQVVEMSGDVLKVVPDNDSEIDLSVQDDADWLAEIISQALVECGETRARIEIRTMP